MAETNLFDRQRSMHWTKPTWIEKEKQEDGTWTKIPHYGQAVPPKKVVSE